MRSYLITTSSGYFDGINHYFRRRVTENVPPGTPVEYVEAYPPRAGFVLSHDRKILRDHSVRLHLKLHSM
jgi:hypothetical protein